MKRIPELRDLSDDHHTGLVLARRCRQCARPGSELSPAEVWAQVQASFRTDLEPHFQIEERHLLPALESIGEGPMAQRIRRDHAALRALCDADASTADASSVASFGVLLKSHIRFEEREVFDSVQDRLPADALASIAAACRALR